MNKEETVTKLFYNEPTKQWHFEDILRSAKISRPQAAKWLVKLMNEGIIKRVKPRAKMPYYLGDYESPAYQSRKRITALNELEKQGFLRHLCGLRGVRTAILFGSMSRWDWHKDSDIDLFILGDPSGFDQGGFRAKLHREIQTFVCKDAKDVIRLKPALLRNIISGYIIKGGIDFVEVGHA